VAVFQALQTAMQRYHNVRCALTDYEPVAGLIQNGLRKNNVMDYCHVKK
jgi:hypothetical protein